MVVGPMLLGTAPNRSCAENVGELARLLGGWEGPGILIFAGDLVDLLCSGSEDASAILRNYPRLTEGLATFAAKPGRKVVWLPGLRDARLGWDSDAAASAALATHAEILPSVRLEMDTAAGCRSVVVEPGTRFDPRSAGDGRPSDTPLAHHLLTEVLPKMGRARDGWLEGIDRLPEPSSLPRFLVSRLLYRRLARYGWLLFVPLLAALALKLPLAYLIPVVGRRVHASVWPLRAAVIMGTTLTDLLLVLVGVALVTRRAWGAVSGFDQATDTAAPSAANDAARAEAARLVTSGMAGLVTGHTLTSELRSLGPGFYANCGAATDVLAERPARLALPSVFSKERRCGWVELEGGAELHVRLLYSASPSASATIVERLVARRRGTSPTAAPASANTAGSERLGVVASFPHGPWWPQQVPRSVRDRRVRRTAAGAIAAAGLLDLLSAVTPPLRARLAALRHLIPLELSQAAAALVALAGLALLALAGGIRRGQRQAWTIGVSLLAGTAVLQLVKRADLVEAAIAASILVFLLRHQSSFGAATDRPSLRRGFLGLVVGAAAATLLGVVGIETDFGIVDKLQHRPASMPITTVLLAVVERLAGITSIDLPGRIDRFLSPPLLAVGIGLAAWALFLAFRPVAARRGQHDGGLTRARELVELHGKGTLDYFALRTDKRYFFHGSSVIAYATWGGVCLVSPDPIGPDAERDVVWAAFRHMVDTQGLVLGVLGAGEDWLPVYRSSGMHDLYVGDEGVVRLDRFSLEGGRNKGLRQAVNRISRHGYTLSFHDPSKLDAELIGQLRSIMSGGRRGEVERGFSMTLGRIFEPDDRGLLLAVAHSPTGQAAAFCQYVPAPGINGYSLDLMRRDEGDHPNGLVDFVVVGTINHLKEMGYDALGLNFATMRAVLAGEAGESLSHRVERWLLKRMSGSMQIESLWKFNSKYDPDWQPRYVVYDSPEHSLAVAMAIARAESFWELPVIGRFLSPSKFKELATPH